jgi:hypothetical protein
MYKEDIRQQWEDKLRGWAKPPSDTESERIERTERMIKDAIIGCPELAKHEIKIFAQGSYRNNTNVRQDSDVDICICFYDTFRADYILAPHLNDAILGFVTAETSRSQLKELVLQALIKKFGTTSVEPGNKAIKIHENTCRVNADAVVALEHRLYISEDKHISGTSIVTNDGKIINNYPEQHYNNGVAKNSSTSRRFKAIVRAMKAVRNILIEQNVLEAKSIPSFLIECLVYNVPNFLLEGESYYKNIQNVLIHIAEAIRDNTIINWLEINDIKILFHVTQPWSIQQVTHFIEKVWEYIYVE